MQRIAALFLALFAFAAHPVAAQTVTYEVVEEDVVLLDLGNDRVVESRPAPIPAGIATFGPFRVLDATHAALVDVTDTGTPAQFAAMLRAYPALAEIDMVDCPGTLDDLANLRIGRMIRAHGIATRVPPGGSVRSGAVELFLAGAHREIDDGATFAVHAWEDDTGRQASDYPADAPENRKYLSYYREMGMSAAQATAFYAMTNSAPFENARWLDAGEMRGWVAAVPAPAAAAPRLARLDLDPRLQ